MSIHFKNQCMIADDVICKVHCETKWQNRQPRLIMRGFCNDVKIENGKATIE